MSEHKQLQPPEYHRCMDTVFNSPAACREFLHRLAAMTDAEIQSKWSPWKDQDPPPYGPDVKKQVSAEVQLVMAEAALAGERASNRRIWRELYDVMGIHPMQESNIELIFGIGRTIDRLKRQIAELEATNAD
uniref:Uncharacterized protein n=2 Tax=Rhodococcus hoagii TaxID=43767 RepID=A0A1Z1UX43_RHOHA|nr:hypothetical protein pVAPN1572_0243 [Prescottella equi]